MATLKQIDWLSVAFAAADQYTAAVDDFVYISDDYEVSLATDGDLVIGIVTTVQTINPTKNVIVKTRFNTLMTLTASAAITVGAKIVAAGSNKFRAYNSGGGDTLDMVVGVAVEAASEDEDTFDALIF